MWTCSGQSSHEGTADSKQYADNHPRGLSVPVSGNPYGGRKSIPQINQYSSHDNESRSQLVCLLPVSRVEGSNATAEHYRRRCRHFCSKPFRTLRSSILFPLHRRRRPITQNPFRLQDDSPRIPRSRAPWPPRGLGRNSAAEAQLGQVRINVR